MDSVREDTGLKGSERFALTHAPSVAAPPPTLWPPAKWRLPLAALERRVELLAERTRTHRFVVGGVLAGILTVLFVAILLEGFGTHAPRSLPQVVVARGAPERSAARLLPPEALPLPSDRRGHEAAAQSELVRDADPVGASAGHPSPKTADPFLPFAPEHGAKGVESRRSPPAPRKAESSAPRAGPARAAALRPNRSPDDTRVNPEPRGGSAHASSNSPAPSATTSFEANSSDGASRPASGGAFAAPPAASSPAPPSAPEPPPVPTGRRVRTDF